GRFIDKIERTFQVVYPDKPSAQSDAYIVNCVRVLEAKGAKPLDCTKELRWKEVPPADPKRPAPRTERTNGAKAFRHLGGPADNLVATTEGGKMKPLRSEVRGETLHSCTAPEHLAQRMPALPVPEDAAAVASPAVKTPVPGMATLTGGDTLYIVGHAN